MSTLENSAERIARNDAVFRQANDRMERTATELGVEEWIPFLCECADPECREVIQLSVAEYEAVRSDSRHFINVPGHEVAARGWGVTVAEHGRYVVVEKIGRAGEIVEALDERAQATEEAASG